MTEVTRCNMSNCRFGRRHDASGQDDRAVTLGLAALAPTERPEGRGSVVVPSGPPRRARAAQHDEQGDWRLAQIVHDWSADM
jgi:hypothetical protein